MIAVWSIWGNCRGVGVAEASGSIVEEVGLGV